MATSAEDLEAYLHRLDRRFEKVGEQTYVVSLGVDQPPAVLRIAPPVIVIQVDVAPAPSGKEFVAWARHREHWARLGSVPLDSAGSGRLIAEDLALSAPPDALRVTLEATGDRSAMTPAGTTVIAWPAEK